MFPKNIEIQKMTMKMDGGNPSFFCLTLFNICGKMYLIKTKIRGERWIMMKY